MIKAIIIGTFLMLTQTIRLEKHETNLDHMTLTPTGCKVNTCTSISTPYCRMCGDMPICSNVRRSTCPF